MSWKIPLFKMYAEQEDIDAVVQVIKRGTFWASGPEIEEFEEKLAQYNDSKFAITFNSGTSALHTLLLAYQLAGKEIIVPSFTFISTANAIILAGAKPIFAEIEPNTLGLDIESVKQKITKSTAGILIVHYAGFPAQDTVALEELAKKKQLLFLEDVAESMGASIEGRKLGTFGEGSILSFCQNKIIATGEGGAIVTDSKVISEKAKIIRSHGRLEVGEGYFSSTGDMDYIQIGYNYRMSSLTAALGLSQLRKINRLIEMRRNIARQLNDQLEKVAEITLPKKMPGHFQVYQMYPILLRDEKTRDGLQTHLAKKRIMAKVYFNPAHLKTLYARDYGYKPGSLPITEELSRRELSLPFYPGMSEEDLSYLIEEIKNYFTP